MTHGHVVRITRHPVKSLVGEDLPAVAIDARGVVGDRLWAVRDLDGRLGSGKSTRRFRQMPGLLDLTARYADDLTPVIELPDGRRVRGDDPSIHQELSDHVGRPVTLAREADVPHHDEGPLHLVTLASLARAGELHRARVDPRQVRANLVVDTGEAPSFDEVEWTGCTLRIGAEVVVRVREPMVRCRMVDLPQVGLPAGDGLLGTLGRTNDTRLGLVVDVIRPGVVELGNALVAVTAD